MTFLAFLKLTLSEKNHAMLRLFSKTLLLLSVGLLLAYPTTASAEDEPEEPSLLWQGLIKAHDGWQYVKKGTKGIADDIYNGIADTPYIGNFIAPTKRNERMRKRILSTLAAAKLIKYNDQLKRYEVKDGEKLKELYQELRDTNAKGGNLLGAHDTYHDDTLGTHSSEYWSDFLMGREALLPGMHARLQSNERYHEATEDAHTRHIDILNEEMRIGVAAGAASMIHALDLITAGQSKRARDWIEDAAQKAKDIKDNPTGAALDYLKESITDELGAVQDDLTAKMKGALVSSMGERNYDAVMEKYEHLGSEHARMKALMDDMYQMTGDDKYKVFSTQLDQVEPGALVANLEAKVTQEVARLHSEMRKTDKDKEKEKEAKEGEDKDKAKEAEGAKGEPAEAKEPKEAQPADENTKQIESFVGNDPQKVRKFAGLVHEMLKNDGVLDPDNPEHVEAMTQLLGKAIRYNRQSPEYKNELDSYMDLRRRVIDAAEGGACEPGSKTEQLAAEFRDKGFALRDAKQTAQAIANLQQSLKLCENEEVAQALAELQKPSLGDGVYLGRMRLTVTSRLESGNKSESLSGGVKLTLSQGQISGQMVAARAIRPDGKDQQRIEIQISGASSQEGQLTGHISGKSSYQGKALSDTPGPDLGRAIDTMGNILGALTYSYSFQGTLSGELTESSGEGTFEGSGVRGKDDNATPITVSGSWNASRQ